MSLPKTEPILNAEQAVEKIHSLYGSGHKNGLKNMEILLERLGNDAGQITIPDIEERITQLEQEIADIMAKDPYQYKYLLASDTDVAQKKEELAAELQEYTEYSDSLEQILSDSIKGRMKITWRMN